MKSNRVKRNRRIRVERGAVVADTTPLITLARIGRLDLLAEIFVGVVIPRAVHHELELGCQRAGNVELASALGAGWLVVHDSCDRRRVAELTGLPFALGGGEAEAIALAEELEARVVLLDDEQARNVAAEFGLTIARTLEVLLAGKRRGSVRSVREELRRCERSGYRVAPDVVAGLLAAAQE